MPPVIEIDDLSTHIQLSRSVVQAVGNVSLHIEPGETLGLVGESGCGKSMTGLSIMGLLPPGGRIVGGSVKLAGRELAALPEAELRKLRGNEMAMIFQDPLSSLHPFYTVGWQIVEAYRQHNTVSKAVARKRAVEMLDRVGIPNPDKRFDDYPHQFSGGMRQRAMIAMALVCDPKLLIADEPTTALDVTVQAQILELMKDLQREFNSAIILITHDLGVVAETCESVVVMYGGQCVEQGSVDDIFYKPQMPYTWGLLGSMPRMDRTRQARLTPIPGTPPSLIQVPRGCVFHPRCRFRDRVANGGEACTTVHPDLEEIDASGHSARCHIEKHQRSEIFAAEIAPNL